MIFWQVYGLFSLLAATFVLWPLFARHRASKKALREDIRGDILEEIVEQHEDELEKTRAKGEISDTEFVSLKVDLAKTLRHDNSLASTRNLAAVTSRKKSRLVLVFVYLLVPIVSILLYWHLGAKQDWDIYTAVRSLHTSSPEEFHNNARELYALIKKRTEERPENAELLFLQGSAATAIGNYDDAVDTYRELNKRYPGAPQIMTELAQALMNRSGGKITPEVRGLIQGALKVAPMMPTALGIAGVDAFQQGNYDKAIEYWSAAVKQLDPNSGGAKAFTQGIAKAEAALGASGKKPRQASKASASLRLKVTLSDAIKLDGDETIFVYARAWQGSKMPLAIRKFKAGELPKIVVLDSTMAMAPGMDLSSAPQLEVVARVSKSGGAVPQSGDWVASYGPVILDELKGPIDLTISQQIP